MNNAAFTGNPMDKQTEETEESDKLFIKAFWEIGMQCFKEFFDKMGTVKAKMIKKSKQVLVQRSAIQTRIHRIVISLDKALETHRQIEKETKRIDEERERIDNGEEFHIWIDKT
eukprot:539673_1